MKDLKPVKGRNYIHSLIEEGEHERQDFKFAISDARKIARSISAFANNDGGRLLIGVKDNGTVAGIRSEEEIYMIETAAEIYCHPAVEVAMTAFKVEQGLVVLRAEIPRSLRPPVMVKEERGELKAYYRVRDENMAAPRVLVRAWQLSAMPDGAFLRLDSSHQRVIDAIRDGGALTIEQIIAATHLSETTAVDMVARLIASSVARLDHDGANFLITI